jgi:hypothetical protein
LEVGKKYRIFAMGTKNKYWNEFYLEKTGEIKTSYHLVNRWAQKQKSQNNKHTFIHEKIGAPARVSIDGEDPLFNRWYHVTFVFNGVNRQIYINGERKYGGPPRHNGPKLLNGCGNLMFPNKPYDYFDRSVVPWKGALAGLRVYNKALKPRQIQHLCALTDDIPERYLGKRSKRTPTLNKQTQTGRTLVHNQLKTLKMSIERVHRKINGLRIDAQEARRLREMFRTSE